MATANCDILGDYHGLMLLASMVEDDIPYHIINSTSAVLGAFDALFAPIDKSHAKASAARGFITTARAVGGSVNREDADNEPQLLVL